MHDATIKIHTTTDHKEGEQLGDRRNGESSCKFGDGTNQRAQSLMLMVMMMIYTGYPQKMVPISKVNNKLISHLTRAQRTPSAAATVRVSHALITTFNMCTLGYTTHIHTVIKFIPDSV